MNFVYLMFIITCTRRETGLVPPPSPQSMNEDTQLLLHHKVIGTWRQTANGCSSDERKSSMYHNRLLNSSGLNTTHESGDPALHTTHQHNIPRHAIWEGVICTQRNPQESLQQQQAQAYDGKTWLEAQKLVKDTEDNSAWRPQGLGSHEILCLNRRTLNTTTSTSVDILDVS